MNPADIRKSITWRRMIRPGDQATSPFGGDWVELAGRRYFSQEDLLAQANAVARIFPEES